VTEFIDDLWLAYQIDDESEARGDRYRYAVNVKHESDGARGVQDTATVSVNRTSAVISV
jgi:hypothetical protein